jgi:lysophospholipase L1-like esterase
MMKKDRPGNKQFWRDAVFISLTLAGLAALTRAANSLYATPHGRFPAVMISVMRSREMLDNPGVTGYYEMLFAATPRVGKNYIYDHSFRMYRFKPNLTWEHDLVSTNGFGLVGRECSERKPLHTRRIALLGDSVTVGHMVRANQTFAALLEDKLNADSAGGPLQRFEVLNFATIAYTLPQILDVAKEEAPRFDPDVYMLDLTELSVFRSWDRHLVQLIQSGIDPKYEFLRETLRRAKVSQQDDALTLYGKLAPYRIPILWATLAEMKSNAALHHASFFVVLMPSVDPGDLSKKRFVGIRELLTSLGIPFIDTLGTFDGILQTGAIAAFPGDPHPNAQGHAMIYRNLYAELRAQPEVWNLLVGEAASGTDQRSVSSAGQSF